MQWIERRVSRDGSFEFLIHDYRGGRPITLYAGKSEAEAVMYMEQYKIRRDLEKEGYEDGLDDNADKKSGMKP
jgi:hypothetical protein